MKTIAVIPAYNEENVISLILNGLKKQVDEIILVDDGSKDNTADEAVKEGVFVLRHLINRGQGAALRTGIDFALSREAEIIITFDADGQHQANEIKELVEPIIKGECQVALGSRFLHKKSKIPILRKFVLKTAIFFNKIFLGLKITDVHNGFRALNREACSLIEIQQDGMAHASEILNEIKKRNLKFKEIPVCIKYTSYSKAKGQSSLNAFKIVWDLIIQKII